MTKVESSADKLMTSDLGDARGVVYTDYVILLNQLRKDALYPQDSAPVHIFLDLMTTVRNCCFKAFGQTV